LIINRLRNEQNTQWINSRKYLNEFSLGNREFTVGQEFSWNGNEWIKIGGAKYVKTFDQLKNIEIVNRMLYDTQSEKYIIFKSLETKFDSMNRPIETVEYDIDENTNQKVPYSRERFVGWIFYSNNILNQRTFEMYRNGAWQLLIKENTVQSGILWETTSISYNTLGSDTLITVFDQEGDFIATDKVKSNKRYRVFEQFISNHTKFTITNLYDQSNTLIFSTKTENEYSAKKQEIRSTVYKSEKGSYVKDSEVLTDYIYDNENLIQEIIKTEYNPSTKLHQFSSKTVYGDYREISKPLTIENSEHLLKPLLAYPNPFNNIIYLNHCGYAELLDTNGKVLKKIDNATYIETADLSSGVYIVAQVLDGKQIKYKVFKE
jgi:hypothetical protein